MAKIRNSLYYIISGLFVVLCFMSGGAIVAGSGYIKHQSYLDGRQSIMLELPIRTLSEIELKDI